MNQSSEQNQNISIGITLGDINGIGPEVVIKTLASINTFKNAFRTNPPTIQKMNY
jgi:4-hydroxy-L-threonine phosphate dehydrogenase PdxA